MRFAWLRANAPHSGTKFDDSASLIDALRLIHEIDIFTSETVKDFATTHERSPFDLPVYELDSTEHSDNALALALPVRRSTHAPHARAA